LDLNAGFFVLRLESSWEAVDLSTGGSRASEIARLLGFLSERV
ncbi:hypothetical protein ZEAMMB73_Zm00001d008181, partial [Zea mays]